jgi:hypothetical protein
MATGGVCCLGGLIFAAILGAIGAVASIMGIVVLVPADVS